MRIGPMTPVVPAPLAGMGMFNLLNSDVKLNALVPEMAGSAAYRFWPATLAAAGATWWMTRNATGARRVAGTAIPLGLLGLAAYGFYLARREDQLQVPEGSIGF
jgi:hypothetical protein